MSNKIIDSEGISCSVCGKDIYHCGCCPIKHDCYPSCHWYISETECELRTWQDANTQEDVADVHRGLETENTYATLGRSAFKVYHKRDVASPEGHPYS